MRCATAGRGGRAFRSRCSTASSRCWHWRVVGERHLKLELGQARASRLNAIDFGGWNGEPPPPRMRIAYRLEPDDYRGGEAMQLVVVHREPAPEVPGTKQCRRHDC